MMGLYFVIGKSVAIQHKFIKDRKLFMRCRKYFPYMDPDKIEHLLLQKREKQILLLLVVRICVFPNQKQREASFNPKDTFVYS